MSQPPDDSLSCSSVECQRDSRNESRAAWAVHPQPLDGESMESWIGRLAYENGYSFYQFTYQYLQSWGNLEVFDYDFLPCDSPASELLSHQLTGGKEKAFRMTLLSYGLLLSSNPTTLRSWATLRDRKRYCPICLSKTEHPYYQLVWRLLPVTVCLQHKVLLRDTCGNCDAPVRLWGASLEDNIHTCQQCGSPLYDSETKAVNSQEEGLSAVSDLLRILNGEQVPKKLRWPYGSLELFDTLQFLAKFLRVRDIKSGDVCTSWHVKWRLDRSIDVPATYDLFARAWSLLVDFPTRIIPFLRENQSELDASIWRPRPRSLRYLSNPGRPRGVLPR